MQGSCGRGFRIYALVFGLWVGGPRSLYKGRSRDVLADITPSSSSGLCGILPGELGAASQDPAELPPETPAPKR